MNSEPELNEEMEPDLSIVKVESHVEFENQTGLEMHVESSEDGMIMGAGHLGAGHMGEEVNECNDGDEFWNGGEDDSNISGDQKSSIQMQPSGDYKGR